MNSEELKSFELCENPFDGFQTWYDIAKTKVENPDVFSFATVNQDGNPRVRFLLLKEFSSEGFKFFTNKASPKSLEIQNNSNVSMAFFWEAWGRQVRIDGQAQELSREETSKFFLSRPLESQAASCVSKQSTALLDKTDLINDFRAKCDELSEFPLKEAPEHWTGYLIKPRDWIFFVYADHRLNDRFEFKQADQKSWAIARLYP